MLELCLSVRACLSLSMNVFLFECLLCMVRVLRTVCDAYCVCWCLSVCINVCMQCESVLHIYCMCVSVSNVQQSCTCTSTPLTRVILYYTILLCAVLCVLCVSGEEDDTAEDEAFYLRPVAAMDFTMAIKKLKASVDDSGKEIMKVRERERKDGRRVGVRGKGELEGRQRETQRGGREIGMKSCPDTSFSLLLYFLFLYFSLQP